MAAVPGEVARDVSESGGARGVAARGELLERAGAARNLAEYLRQTAAKLRQGQRAAKLRPGQRAATLRYGQRAATLRRGQRAVTPGHGESRELPRARGAVGRC